MKQQEQILFTKLIEYLCGEYGRLPGPCDGKPTALINREHEIVDVRMETMQ